MLLPLFQNKTVVSISMRVKNSDWLWTTMRFLTKIGSCRKAKLGAADKSKLGVAEKSKLGALCRSDWPSEQNHGFILARSLCINHGFIVKQREYLLRTPSLVTRTRRLVSRPKCEKMCVASWHIYEPYPTKFHLHLGRYVLIRTRIWWALPTGKLALRATSHMRLRARDHYTSSTLIGGQGKAGPRSFHTMLEGPTEYVNARWMWSLHAWMPTWHRMDHVSWSLGLFSKTTSWK